MAELIYYIKNIPDIESVTQYNHALGIAEYDSDSTLLTHQQPPEPIQEQYEVIEVLNAETPIGRVANAVRFVNDAVERTSETLLLTAGQIEPVVAGRLSRAHWVVDLYDDPLQGIKNDPLSRHQITDRIVKRLVANAPLGVNTLHVDAHNKAGIKKQYCINGAPTTLIDHRIPERTKPLRAVVAGKVTLKKGMNIVIDGLAATDVDVVIEAYGEVNGETERYCRRAGVKDRVRFHGQTQHAEVMEAVSDAHAGLCVLPAREDWKYHYPIKLGEYLAGGTVPIASDFPAFRELCGDSGIYVTPSADGVARGIEEFDSLSSKKYRNWSQAARRRGEEVRWKRVRTAFTSKCRSGWNTDEN